MVGVGVRRERGGGADWRRRRRRADVAQSARVKTARARASEGWLGCEREGGGGMGVTRELGGACAVAIGIGVQLMTTMAVMAMIRWQ